VPLVLIVPTVQIELLTFDGVIAIMQLSYRRWCTTESLVRVYHMCFKTVSVTTENNNFIFNVKNLGDIGLKCGKLAINYCQYSKRRLHIFVAMKLISGTMFLSPALKRSHLNLCLFQ
jgi:hypothetical protein